MEAEIGPGRLSNNRIASYTNQSVLILNQNSVPCVAAKCDSLFPLLKKSLAVKYVYEQDANRTPDRLALKPDLILLRPAVAESPQELIQSCKKNGIGQRSLRFSAPNGTEHLKIFPQFSARLMTFFLVRSTRLNCFYASSVSFNQYKATRAPSSEQASTNEALLHIWKTKYSKAIGESRLRQWLF
jgi:hypothetical protein